MAESVVQVTEGSGKKLHTYQRTIGANSVEDEVILHGEPYLASYVVTAVPVSIANANDHILQIMAGASLNVYLRSLKVYQLALATTTTIARFEILRVSTAGTGGTANTPAALDATDAASGATGMTLPTVKGTEGNRLGYFTGHTIQTLGTGGGGMPLLFERTWDGALRTKAPRIAAGTTNGIVLKSIVAVAACTVLVEAIVTEANF